MLQIKLNGLDMSVNLQILIPYCYKYYNWWAMGSRLGKMAVSIHLPPYSRTGVFSKIIQTHEDTPRSLENIEPKASEKY